MLGGHSVALLPRPAGLGLVPRLLQCTPAPIELLCVLGSRWDLNPNTLAPEAQKKGLFYTV